uniref:AIPP2-like SPOC-like domain-containing protein n=1 Tax=Chenopodium quinoa TaxID=63459 RepID=A0A803KX51_CHEQI
MNYDPLSSSFISSFIGRYCVDGPANIDDDEVRWSCEVCVPRMLEASPAVRKSEHIVSKVDQETLHGLARNKCLSMSKVEESNCVKKRANKGADDSSTLNEKKKEFVKSKEGKLKKNKIASKMGGSEPSPLLGQKKKVNSAGGAKKESSDPYVFTGQNIKDLNSLCGGEDLQTDQEMYLGSQLSEESAHGVERTDKVDEIRVGDSVSESCHKHGQSLSGIHSSILDEQQEIGCSQTFKQSDGAEDITSDNIGETKAVPASHQMDQTRRKKRRLVISVEYSDSDEEPVYVRADHHQILPNVSEGLTYMHGEPSAKGLDQRRLMKSHDHCPTQPSPNIKSDDYMPPPKFSIDHDKCVIPPLSNVMPDIRGPAQPIMNAVWRGFFSISDDVHPMSFKLEAHLSNKAHEKVIGAASALPNSLSFEIFQKADAWPKSFEIAPPHGDMIGLYFFPVDERDEKRYEVLLDKMIEDELVLKSRINNLELLVFSSQELPREEWRFRSKYYLWSVFKPKQETFLTSGLPGSQISDSMYHKKDLGIAEKVGVQRVLQA